MQEKTAEKTGEVASAIFPYCIEEGGGSSKEKASQDDLHDRRLVIHSTISKGLGEIATIQHHSIDLLTSREAFSTVSSLTYTAREHLLQNDKSLLKSHDVHSVHVIPTGLSLPTPSFSPYDRDMYTIQRRDLRPELLGHHVSYHLVSNCIV